MVGLNLANWNHCAALGSAVATPLHPSSTIACIALLYNYAHSVPDTDRIRVRFFACSLRKREGALVYSWRLPWI